MQTEDTRWPDSFVLCPWHETKPQRLCASWR